MNRNDLIADIAVRTGKTKKDISEVVHMRILLWLLLAGEILFLYISL